MQARLDLIHIEMVALEEVGFLFLKKSRCPFVNQIGDDQFAPINQHLACALQNIFGNGTLAHVYKPLDLNVRLKSRNGKKICHPNTFKLSILQENKWEVG
jgi:hypothetical protein